MQQQYNTYVGWYVCGEFSTTTVPQWTRGDCYPSVFWTHILCGQFTKNGVAQGFHSETETSNWYTWSVSTANCLYYADGNGVCRDVYIYINKDKNYKKASGSSVFNYEISATNLINYLQRIAFECKTSNSFCAKGCTYSRYRISFSIYFHMVDRGVLSAYPKLDCNTNVCYPKACRNMN